MRNKCSDVRSGGLLLDFLFRHSSTCAAEGCVPTLHAMIMMFRQGSYPNDTDRQEIRSQWKLVSNCLSSVPTSTLISAISLFSENDLIPNQSEACREISSVLLTRARG